MKTPFIHLWAAALLAGTAPLQAEWRAPLEDKELTNGDQTLAPLADLEGQVQKCTALLMDKKGKAVATATWVGKEGYFITKASEVPRLEECTLKRASAPEASIREIRRDTQHDLVLAQAIQVQGVTPVRFDSSKELTFGQWLASPSLAKDLKIGVVSAQRRTIKGFGAAIGIRMEDKVPGEAGGVRIIGVAEDSPAASAGLKTNDIMLELAGETVSEFRRVNEIISKRQPGEEIVVKFKRGNKEDQLHVRLASRTKVLANWDGEDFANGGISIRTDNFTEVLQHDVPLSPADMGGPLVDLNGRAVGINIARVDRVTTFALPGELFWPMVQKWIKADRNPPKAVPAKMVKSASPESGKNEAARKPRG
ncbi:PDZ domain-containing protein [Prosthecobacter sp. SYSU 5D2]|uniref:PDZ domain-containing protein n=1 Tax=Prosthecobacter sp. SYSU 5D2 TaxID=3134134 RepID=UPI0031FEFBA9